MASHEPIELWRQIRDDLRRARATLPAEAIEDPALQDWLEYVDEGEFGLAAELLEDYAERLPVMRVFWLALRDATERMRSTEQVARCDRELVALGSPVDLPLPPTNLRFDAVTLAFVRMIPGDPSRGFAPSYHFRILVADDRDVGHLNFRVGDSSHVTLTAGHIGFEIAEAEHGHGYAYQACRAIGPFVRTIYASVLITCDPTNAASRRTIERLGATFIDEVAVPPHDPAYARGSRSKLRYRWTPEPI